MLNKIKKQKNIISLSLMIILTSFTQIFILLKSSLVAGLFGTSLEMDAYNLANSITTFLFGILAAGIPTVIIPCYVRSEDSKVVDNYLTIVYGLILIMSIFLSAFRVHIIGVFSNREEMFVNITCEILIIFLFAQFLVSITGVTDAYFQCENKYNIPKVINLFSQILVVIALLIFRKLSIYQYTLIIAAGLIFTFSFNIIFAIKNGWRYKPRFHIKDEKVQMLLKIFLPIIFSSGVYKLTLLVDSLIASRLDAGMITILSYSNQIAAMVDTVLIGNLLNYAYPKIVKNIKNGVSQIKFWNQTILFHNIVLLVIVGFYSIGYEGVSILFRHGSFSEEAAYLVYCGALIYIFGQQTATIINLIYRYFYSLGDTKSTAQNSLIVSILNIIISVILVKIIGFFGIILGTIISSAISVLFIIMKFNKKIGLDTSFKNTIKGYLKNIIVAIITIMIIYITKQNVILQSKLVSILLFGSETVIIYVLFTVILNKKIFELLKEV